MMLGEGVGESDELLVCSICKAAAAGHLHLSALQQLKGTWLKRERGEVRSGRN